MFIIFFTFSLSFVLLSILSILIPFIIFSFVQNHNTTHIILCQLIYLKRVFYHYLSPPYYWQKVSYQLCIVFIINRPELLFIFYLPKAPHEIHFYQIEYFFLIHIGFYQIHAVLCQYIKQVSNSAVPEQASKAAASSAE